MEQSLTADKNLRVIADLVYETCGIVFKDSNLAVLASRLTSKLKEKSLSAPDYVRLLQTNKTELTSFIDFVTTNFTSFFRNPKQFELLQEEILPEIIKRNQESKTIHIWSAACSSGEEPYTIAMVVSEYFEKNKLIGWSCSITGSDISLESLFTAKEARFPLKSLEKVEKRYIDNYFSPAGDSYLVKDEIRKMVRFDFHNLIYDNGIRNMDIVFCRNVLIYFDEDIQKKVLSGIHLGMKPGGYLFIGHSESLFGLFEGFKAQSFTKGIVYGRQ